jgi:hypothetical protein
VNRSARLPARHSSAPPIDFNTLLPTIERQIVFAFRRVPAPFREDVHQEALVAAFVAYRRLADRGRHHQIFATPLAQFAVCRVRDGRRVGSPRNRLDVSCPFVARCRGFRLERIDRFDPHSCRWTLMAIPCSAASVPDQVAFRLDFPKWLSIQTARDRRLIQALACGETTCEAARRFHISAARVSQLRLEFFQSWRAFQGEVQDAPATVAI